MTDKQVKKNYELIRMQVSGRRKELGTNWATDFDLFTNLVWGAYVLNSHKLPAAKWSLIIDQTEAAVLFVRERFFKNDKFRFPRLFGWIKIFRFARKWCNEIHKILKSD